MFTLLERHPKKFKVKDLFKKIRFGFRPISHSFHSLFVNFEPRYFLLDEPSLGLAACRTYGVDSENRPQRRQFLPDLQAHSPAMGQKDGEKWTAVVDSQPTFHQSDRLLVPQIVQQIFSAIETARQELRTTIVLCEEVAALALSVSQQGYVLRRGEVVQSGTAAEISNNPNLSISYLGA